MKAELLKIPGKGVCILISDININDISNIMEIQKGPFTNIHAIANEIKNGLKISAIKECRAQTGWGLMEAKEYIEKYMHHGSNVFETANKFLEDHTYESFFDIDEFKI